MRRAILVAGFAALATFALGCATQTPATFDAKTVEATGQLKKVGTAYNKAYQSLRRSPTAEEIKPYLKQYGDPDALLISPRDGKPLVLVPGFVQDTEQTGGEQPIIVYEQSGADGKRMTVDSRGTIVFFTDSEFAKLKFVGGHQPAR